MRYKVLIEGQKLVMPKRLKELLGFGRFAFLTPVVPLYMLARLLKTDWEIKNFLIPSDYHGQIKELGFYTSIHDKQKDPFT